MRNKIIVLVVILTLIGMAGYTGYRQYQFSKLRKTLEAEIETLFNAHKVRLSNAPEIVRKQLARKRYKEEWRKRLSYDPQFAFTFREKTVLKMVSISKDKALSTNQILKEVAILASPRDSKVKISKLGKGYVVNVAFDMAVMTSGETGARTKHSTKESLKREVVEIISRVMKDLYDHCGTKGVEKIVVAVEHGVIHTMFPGLPGGTPRMTVIYKCSISKRQALRIANWREAKLHQVSSMLKVEHDEFPYLTIRTTVIPGFQW